MNHLTVQWLSSGAVIALYHRSQVDLEGVTGLGSAKWVLTSSWCCAGQRGTVAFAGGAGLVVLVAVPLSLFARLSLAVLTVGNVLFWKACMLTQASVAHKV